MKSQHFLLALFIAALFGVYILYKPFLLTITIAALLAVSTSGIQKLFLDLTGSNFLASALSSILLALLFFAPLGYFLATLTIMLNDINPTDLDIIYQKILLWVSNIPPDFEIIKGHLEDLLSASTIQESATKAVAAATTIGKYSAHFLKNAFLIIVFYFFAQYHGRYIFAFFKEVIHLKQQDTTQLSYELSSVMSVVFYSIIVTAMFEGALFGIAVSYFGYNGLLFGIMYGFASLLPVIGGALMWVPFMVYELAIGNTMNAIIIALYSIIVISIVADTFIKPLIIKWINDRFVRATTKMNELLIFFAIIAGLTTFGFWGMILGPAITAFFLAILKIVGRQSDSWEHRLKR
ncbi:MAG: AI-2E family transporter [Campylobacterota bacterium]|nr:AI-2E family transporter [Campylobacterota bacterium]